VTSQAFIDRTGIQVEGASYAFLEAYRKGVGKWEALTTLLKVRWLPGAVRASVPHVGPDWCCSPAARRRPPRRCP
jgi:hypothetical protein